MPVSEAATAACFVCFQSLNGSTGVAGVSASREMAAVDDGAGHCDVIAWLRTLAPGKG